MSDQNPLYYDREITIDHHPTSFQDHYLTLHTTNENNSEYIIPRGCLQEVARTPRNSEHGNDLESLMRRINETMVEDALGRGLSVDSLGFAMMQAYTEEEQRIEHERFLRRAIDAE